MGLEPAQGQLRELRGTPAAVGVYGCGDGGEQGEGAGDDVGEDDSACGEAAGGAGLIGVGGVEVCGVGQMLGCCDGGRWGGERDDG